VNNHRVLPAKLFAPFVVVYFQGVGPGDGLNVLFYLLEMVLSIRIYAVAVIATRRTNRRA
jgi:hypothetical protein